MAIKVQFYNIAPEGAIVHTKTLTASMAKLVRRHTSNVEIIGSNPIGSNFATLKQRYLGFMFYKMIWMDMRKKTLVERQL